MHSFKIDQFIFTWYFILVYILSTNSLFIPLFNFNFNPSKLFVILTFPLLLLFSRKNLFFRSKDFLFFIFITLVLINFFITNNFKTITNLSNIIIPFIFYLLIRANLKKINLIFALRIILFFVTLHAILGLIQFYTGDRNLLVVNEIQEWKARYASNFFFNPFQELFLLPQGLYAYSSVLAISLIFPLYLIFSLNTKMNKIIFFSMLILFSTTVFLTFSRFEILSIIILISFSYFLLKNNKILIFRFFLLYMFFISLILIYMSTTSDQLGTAQARIITVDKLEYIFHNVRTLIFGVDSIFSFRDDYGIDIPHNMYVFSIMQYGIIATLFLFTYFYLQIKEYFKINVLANYSLIYTKIYNYLLLFLLFLFFFRAFDYYILDGYENILLFFYVFSILDYCKIKLKKGNL